MSNKVFNFTLQVIKKIFQIILLFVLVFGIIAVIVGSMLGISIIRVAEESPEVNPENILVNLNQNSKILDKDGKIMESIAYEEYREIISIEDMPNHLIDAFVSLEDERFDQHDGVDIISIARSFKDNLRAGGIVQGGSTITQQLVKNVYLSNDVKWERKIQEMYLALELEDKLDKEEIMEGYLNRIFLGQHSYGVESAAETYFSKSAKDLNLAQSAALASIVQAPSSYSLFISYPKASVPEDARIAGEYKLGGDTYTAVLNDKVENRKNYTLKKMLELGKITQSEYDEAVNFDLMSSIKPSSKVNKDYSSDIASLIKKEAIERIMDTQDMNREEAINLLYTGGLEITTTIDWDVQEKLEETYNDFANIFKNDTRRGGPILADFSFDQYGDVVDSNNRKLFYKRSNLINENNNVYVPEGWYSISENGDLTIKSSRFTLVPSGIYVVPFYRINDNNEFVTHRVGVIDIPTDQTEKLENGFKIKASFFENIKDFYTIEDGNLVINNEYYNLENEGTVQPQSSTVIVDSKNGEIKAMVSKRGSSQDDTMDRATNFFRQPSSTMKPVAVYAPALEEEKITLASPIDDTPFRMLNNKAWPKNFNNRYQGIVTARDALHESLNPPAVKILNDSLGIEKSKEYLAKFGLINKDNPERDNFITADENLETNDENLAMSFGSLTKGMTVKDMASAYQTFANNGKRIESSIISKIEKPGVGTIYVNNHNEIDVISEETNFLVTNVMEDILNSSYLKGARNRNGIATAGKTGTSDNNGDFWFTGFNPYYTAATWIGFDNVKLSLVGNSGVSGRLFGQYMNKIVEGMDEVEFTKPDTIVTETVNKVDGLLPSRLTRRDPRGGSIIYNEYFKKGTEPTEVSNSHIQVDIDIRNDLLAAENTPSNLRATRVFVDRPIKYDPNKFNGIFPEDWKYNAPTRYSDLPVINEPQEEILPDGTIIVTKTQANGNVVVTTTKPDGTIITQITTPDGKVTTSTQKPETEEETEEETNEESNSENETSFEESIQNIIDEVLNNKSRKDKENQKEKKRKSGNILDRDYWE